MDRIILYHKMKMDYKIRDKLIGAPAIRILRR
jgi:hypothetical protein